MGSVGDSNVVQQNGAATHYDVLVIGAGISGVYSLYRLRQLGLSAKALERGTAEGGTWYWNRYPGARFDSESYSYQYFFSKDLMDEWDWKEHFAGQPEILAYIKHVVDKFDLRRDMQFNTQITAAKFIEEKRMWELTDQHGNHYTSRWLITAIGILTNPTLPNIPGVKDFKGISHHTSRWPRDEPVTFEGKRVAVIGTGATGMRSLRHSHYNQSKISFPGIQTIQEVAKTARHLTVFQRTPNWACPMKNAAISTEEMTEIRNGYPELMRMCSESYMAFTHMAEPRATTDVTSEEREAFWDHLYDSRGQVILCSDGHCSPC
jgi:cation diffusion facilitator CzcD-associated flavoprotein CzcO